ncbi:MAG: class I SAM-dependent rRNA methyltransferase [Planctomycetales bacterium]|nr:class I SAM-dependent rRNA methyltransferase [Planctomycetales bacterium]
MPDYPQIFLNAKRSHALDGFHPWILDRSVIDPTLPLPPGTIVDCLLPSGASLGRGIYNPNSRIRIRLYQKTLAEDLDEAWLLRQLERACNLRNFWMSRNHNLDALRLVNSEGDGLSGVIIDRFGDCVVIQLTAYALLPWLDLIADWIESKFAPQAIFLRIDAATAKQEGLESKDELLRGIPPTGPLQIVENSVKLAIDLSASQKTGYYLDQRANRAAAARWIEAGPLLDVCCYVGGFSLAARQWTPATEITAVDSSLRALEGAERNLQLNGFPAIDFVQADCFDYLEHLVSENAQFQTVILDPPRMASHRGQVAAAIRAYHRLNLNAVRILSPGGLLVTCSCSGRVSREDFAGLLGAVSRKTKRRLQILESRSADFDHPVDTTCLESEYLKCLICRVE